MAPYAAESARQTQTNPRPKPAARIAPAIPLSLQRRPQPKVVATPEDSERASAGEKINEQAPTPNRHAEDVEQATAGAAGILTPKSGISATYGQEAGSEAIVESCPAVSQHDSAPAANYDCTYEIGQFSSMAQRLYSLQSLTA